MAKYIDAEKIPYYLIAPDDTNTMSEGKRVAFKNEIDKMTAADVQEVRHGRWEKKPTHNGAFEFWFCSECAKGGGCTINPKFNYCPICGAKMDGKGNDGN